MSYKTGEEFLNKLYKDMHMSDFVMHTAEKQDSPEKKISRYMERLENVHEIAKSNSHKMDLLKHFYYQKYVIKELPESYINLQKKIYREQGYGEATLTEELLEEMLKQAQEEQKSSLNYWIEYLTSDDAMYPMWFKNYVFQGMLQLGKFDKEKSEFTKRTETMVDGFLELNPEILAQIYNVLSHEIGEEDLDQEDIKALEKGESFKKLYTYYLTKQGFQTNYSETDGIWIRYEQGDNYQELLKSIQGKNTGWCTAGEKTCQTQLKYGDFYVYYTKDEAGKYTNPRIAIRMNGKTSIGEVRGVGKAQNLEANMVEIANKKLDEFPDKEEYQKKVHDMKFLTEIDNKVNNGIELTPAELKFLYEIEDEIIGFGFQKDPRINEIRQKRNNITDLNTIFSVYKKIDNKLNLNYLKSVEGLTLPDSINDSLNLSGLTSVKDLKLPDTIEGNIDLSNIKNTENLTLPMHMQGILMLSSLTNIKNLKFPKTIDGILDLRSLTSAEDLIILPENVNGFVNLSSLTSGKNVKFPNTISGTLDLNSLTNAEGLKLPNTVGNLLLGSLISAEDLILPENINGAVDLSDLTDVKNLKFPNTVNGEIGLGSLKSAEGLTLPKTINGYLDLKSLTNTEGLTLPKTINGYLVLNNLTSAVNLILPETINGELYLSSLTSAKDLIFPNPEGIKSIYLNSLQSCEDLVVSKSMIDKISLSSTCNRDGIVVLSDSEYRNYRKEKIKEIELSKMIKDNYLKENLEKNNSIKDIK